MNINRLGEVILQPIAKVPQGAKLLIYELSFVIEPSPGLTTFQAEGLTLGERVERRMVYRFRGLVAK